jgi:acetyltransferase-like isoleucine patch superfamily enzyme
MILPSAPVGIEDHVWIGSRVSILTGVRIGHTGRMVGSVVRRGGNHAQDPHSSCAH